ECHCKVAVTLTIVLTFFAREVAEEDADVFRRYGFDAISHYFDSLSFCSLRCAFCARFSTVLQTLALCGLSLMRVFKTSMSRTSTSMRDLGIQYLYLVSSPNLLVHVRHDKCENVLAVLTLEGSVRTQLRSNFSPLRSLCGVDGPCTLHGFCT